MKTEREKIDRMIENNFHSPIVLISALEKFIIADRRRIAKPLVDLGQIKKQPLPTYEALCCAIEETLKLAGIEEETNYYMEE